MPTFSIIAPLDQPLGNRRLLEDIKRCLSSKDLEEFGFVVAFAKAGPLYRLQELLEKWRTAGKSSVGIFGIDHLGTSIQALDFSLEHLDRVFFTQHRGNSFHPKVYWFRGKKRAVAFIGSNNLTMGGMELNFEATIELNFELPAEKESFEDVHRMFSALLPETCSATQALTRELLGQLIQDQLLLDESKKGSGVSGTKRATGYAKNNSPRLPVRPISSLPPKGLLGQIADKKELQQKAAAIAIQAKSIEVTKPLVPVMGLAMQIKPHHNGEIFLSRTAAQQNPAFFGMPFTGETTPKKGTNSGYPQRLPDPIVNIAVFGKRNELIFSLENYPLNTVFYEEKKEIRVTASPLVEWVPEYSVMVMTLSELPEIEYDIAIFTPDSPDHPTWLAVCNQTMPGGGKVPRKFGWY
ncbi:restriction endonuclease [Herbaspirillum frisingense]|nr:restriction endonuclease [Herbaspirillum frisingense]